MKMTHNPGSGAQRGGDIFKHVSFWLSHRVPMRNHWVHQIKSNGGTVVLMEQDADMLIADHAKKGDAPAGSYSWKFIEDSIENGIMQLKERYLIGPDPDLPRPGGSGKSFRRAYTVQDNAALARWALEHPEGRRGNAIWMEFGSINKAHTWQSWRDRFVKHLGNLSDQQLQAMASRHEESRAEPQVRARRSPARPGPSTAVRDAEEDAEDEIQVATAVPDSSTSLRSMRVHEMSLQSQRRDTSSPTKQVSVRVSAAEATAPSDDGAELVTIRQRFYSDFQDFAEANDAEMDVKCSIGGQEFELWDLLLAISLQEVQVDELDWTQVAEELNGGWARDPEVVVSLKRCFEERLADFLEAAASFTQTLGAEEEPGPVSSQGQLPPRVLPHSPTAGAAANKRLLDLSFQGSAWRTPKRRKLSRNAEIPSTPGVSVDDDEDFYQRRLTNDPTSPSMRKSTGRSRTRAEVVRGKSSQQASPSLRRAREEKRRAEPMAMDLDEESRHEGAWRALETAWTDSEEEREEEEEEEEEMEEEMEEEAEEAVVMMEDDPMTTTSPSTLKALPKLSKRALPVAFQPRKSPSPPKPRPPPYAHPGNGSGRASSGETRRRLNEWLEHYESLGYTQEIVHEAMERTTMTPGNLALTVMHSLTEGHGVPKNYQGIWTDRDDNGLRFVDSVDTTREPSNADEARRLKKAKKEWDRIVDKHGVEPTEQRRKFLQAHADLKRGRLR